MFGWREKKGSLGLHLHFCGQAGVRVAQRVERWLALDILRNYIFLPNKFKLVCTLIPTCVNFVEHKNNYSRVGSDCFFSEKQMRAWKVHGLPGALVQIDPRLGKQAAPKLEML